MRGSPTGRTEAHVLCFLTVRLVGLRVALVYFEDNSCACRLTLVLADLVFLHEKKFVFRLFMRIFMRFDGKWVIFMFLGRMNMGRIPMQDSCGIHALGFRMSVAWVSHEC